MKEPNKKRRTKTKKNEKPLVLIYETSATEEPGIQRTVIEWGKGYRIVSEVKLEKPPKLTGEYARTFD